MVKINQKSRPIPFQLSDDKSREISRRKKKKLSPDNLDFSERSGTHSDNESSILERDEGRSESDHDASLPAKFRQQRHGEGGRSVRFNGLETKKGDESNTRARVCPRAKARSQGVAGENSVTVSQYTPETFSNAREKFAQGIGGGCASQRTRISTWSLRFLPPFSNNPLPRTTIRGALVAFARGREQESRRGVCWCVCPHHGREGETYI